MIPELHERTKKPGRIGRAFFMPLSCRTIRSDQSWNDPGTALSL
jgi:hypothetical protein